MLNEDELRTLEDEIIDDVTTFARDHEISSTVDYFDLKISMEKSNGEFEYRGVDDSGLLPLIEGRGIDISLSKLTFTTVNITFGGGYIARPQTGILNQHSQTQLMKFLNKFYKTES